MCVAARTCRRPRLKRPVGPPFRGRGRLQCSASMFAQRIVVLMLVVCCLLLPGALGMDIVGLLDREKLELGGIDAQIKLVAEPPGV